LKKEDPSVSSKSRIVQTFTVAGLSLFQDEFYENIVVHFDLKGAPPRVSYFLDLLDIVARSGATGVLLEWEDMFPWTGQLAVAKSTDAYSLDEVILAEGYTHHCRALNLDVIPLVQTFGHLEWILKLEQFRKYRENDAYPQVICLGDEEAVAIVRDALKQVIDVHKEFGLNYFHIGADEAFEFGVCTKSQEWIASHGSGSSKQLLALNHLKNISQYVKQLTSGATVLAWHDMLKDFDTRVISQLELGNLIEPVIWDYSENIVTMPDSSFAQIANNFPVVWASSAFKGANFPSAKYIDIRHYETNNRAWIDTKIAQQEKFTKFHGIIITGWQRYDHMAAICEIWPMGTPSMVLNVQIAKMGASKDYHVARDRAARVLGCREFHVGGLDLISNRCTNYRTAQQTISYIETELEKNHHIMGWLSPYNMRYNYTQNWYVFTVERELSKLFFDNTVDEFIYLTISPTIDRLQKYLDEVKRLSALRVYPKRPFRI
uniref:beta-N-acetylhexosaminidase n=1 Tax=Haemonchus placei TaxID=6290 RepID=A0A0N4X2N1_HAEPC